jgi:hypothetical protein
MSGSKARYLAQMKAEQDEMWGRDSVEQVVAKRADRRAQERQGHRGAAMTGSGSVLAGTGVLAGGIPGAREPRSLNVWNLHEHQETGRRTSGLGKAKIIAPLPRAGILGFRANMHHDFITETNAKTGGSAYQQGKRAGQLKSEHSIVRGMRLGRRASYGLTAGGAALALAGHRRSQQSKVGKRDLNRGNASAAALGTGATVAGVSQAASTGLGRFGRKYGRSAQQHTLAAQRLAPHYGGLVVIPAKHNAFGQQVKPAKTTIKPEIPNWKVEAERYDRRIKGGAKVKAQVGHHRGVAAQERHFAEVFNNTARGFKRARNPALAVAGLGAAGLWGANGVHKALKVTGVRAVPKAVNGFWEAAPHPEDLREAERLAAQMKNSAGGTRHMVQHETRNATKGRLVMPEAPKPRPVKSLGRRRSAAIGGAGIGIGGGGLGRMAPGPIGTRVLPMQKPSWGISKRNDPKMPLKTSISEGDAKKIVGRVGLTGPLPKGLNREQKMAHYEARYVSAGGHKASRWQHKANAAERTRVTATGAVGASGAGWLLAHRAHGGGKIASKIIRHPASLKRGSEIAGVGAATVEATSDLYGAHARRKRSSYASAPSGVAASALRRMQAYTPNS